MSLHYNSKLSYLQKKSPTLQRISHTSQSLHFVQIVAFLDTGSMQEGTGKMELPKIIICQDSRTGVFKQKAK
jgi:hypothetical protein